MGRRRASGHPFLAKRQTEEPTMVAIVPVVDEGLGNSSYLVDLGDGRALVVDPVRDPTPYLDLAHQRRLRLTHAVETHLHADFVSGSRELAARDARIVAARAAGLRFPHQGLDDEEELDLGGLVLRALATPGHTPEHVAWLLLDAGRPLALFSGGALLVGGVARTDLIGPDQTEPLTRPPGARCSGYRPCPTTCGSTPPTGPGRSARPRVTPSGPPPSAPNGPTTCCCPPPTSRRSPSGCSAGWAASPRTSCGCERSTSAARGSSPSATAPSRRCRSSRSGAGLTTGRCWSTSAPPRRSGPAIPPARCRSRCARRSRPGSAGWSSRTGRCCSSARPARSPTATFPARSRSSSAPSTVISCPRNCPRG